MNGTEESLLEALLELEKAVNSIRSGNTKPDLLSLFGRIEALTEELPHETVRLSGIICRNGVMKRQGSGCKVATREIAGANVGTHELSFRMATDEGSKIPNSRFELCPSK